MTRINQELLKPNTTAQVGRHAARQPTKQQSDANNATRTHRILSQFLVDPVSAERRKCQNDANVHARKPLQLSVVSPRRSVCLSQDWVISGILCAVPYCNCVQPEAIRALSFGWQQVCLLIDQLLFHTAAYRSTRLQTVASQLQEFRNLTKSTRLRSRKLHAGVSLESSPVRVRPRSVRR